MKVYLLRQLRNLFRPRNIKKSKKFLIYLTFFIITSIIWLFNKVDKNYFYNYLIPVIYTGFPENKIQVNPLPNKINITIYGNGIQIIKHKILSIKPLVINVNPGYIFLKEYYYETSNLINDLKKYFKEELQIINIEPKIILMKFEEKKSKIIPVVPEINIISNNFKIDSVKVFPNFILISGPSETIFNINKCYTQKITLTQPVSELKHVKLINKYSKCEIKPDKVNLKIYYSNHTNLSFKIPLNEIKNYQKNFKYSEKFINIKMQITSNISQNEIISNLSAILEYKFSSPKNGYARVLISSLNNNIKIIYYYPHIIKFYQ
ncbi:MAG: hypothetical protein N3A01_09600 [Bacteroidales bacterium]|nr:hypothetical protein [Bacteroidales bacterium]